MVEVPLQSVLAEQAELQDCMMRVESFLARAEAVLCRLTIMPDLPPLAEIQVDSKGEGETDPYGCFSPRNRHIAEVVTPVIQIMPGLQELCEAPSPPLSMVLPKEMGLVMPMMPSLPMLAASPPSVVVDNEGHDSPLSCVHLETLESLCRWYLWLMMLKRSVCCRLVLWSLASRLPLWIMEFLTLRSPSRG